MATVKLDLRRDVKFRDNHLPIVLVVIANRKKLVIHLGHSVRPEHWDEDKGLPNAKCPNSAHLKGLLLSKLALAGKEVLKMEEEIGRVDLKELKRKIKPQEESKGIQAYAQAIADKQVAAGNIGNSRAYLSTISMLKKFAGDKEINFSEFNYKKLLEFEQFMASKKLQTNTIAFYMRTLRAILNRAVKEGVCKDTNYVFRDYRIRHEETRKRAITKTEIDAIRNLNLETSTPMEFARDMFMFSFYTRGMNLIDIAYLKKADIRNGRIEYSRRKTSQQFSIKLTEAATVILERYHNDSPFAFPVIKRKGNEYLDYVSFKRLVNKKLKDIAELAEISTPLTTYVARHSWATIAKRQGISTAIISEGLGHETEQTTQVYLDSFENDVLDRANELVTG
ncbi:MAG: site-specific integrase [Bacteroidales bacterium]